MRYARFWLMCALVVVWGCTQMQGCVPARASRSEVVPVEVLESESLRLVKNPVIETSVYVSLRDASGRVFGLRQMMEDRLRARGYTVTENPSRAGYILQLHVVQAGQGNPAVLRDGVSAGYGHKMPPAGDGACALVVDVLVALRKEPKTSGRQSHVIKSASARTTVSRHQLRTAALAAGQECVFSTALPQLERGLVEAVVSVLPPLRGRE